MGEVSIEVEEADVDTFFDKYGTYIVLASFFLVIFAICF